jgi:signal transduction histidine kinase
VHLRIEVIPLAGDRDSRNRGTDRRRRRATVPHVQRPDVLDSRAILRVYGLASLIAGIIIVGYRWPAPDALARTQIGPPQLWSLILMVAANAVWLSGAAAAGFGQIEDARTRARALRVFGLVLLAAGILYWAPAYPVIRIMAPAVFGWAPLLTGLIMLSVSRENRVRLARAPHGHGVVFREKLTLAGRYEEQIRAAARQEERARLARDLHDAVKQQLFVIQTAAATVESRFDDDAAGARAALTQVRASAREALSEMEVMLEQLQARPIGNAGLIESLKRQCDVLRFRTGADVRFEASGLPADTALPPGAHQAMLRVAQEALANVARHARARHVDVTLSGDTEAVTLTVADDGQGFDVGTPQTGIGLTSISARAAELDGSFAVDSSPGTGTAVRLIIPISSSTASSFFRYRALTSAAILAVCPFLFLFSEFSNPGMKSAYYVIASLAAASLVRYGIAWWRMRA